MEKAWGTVSGNLWGIAGMTALDPSLDRRMISDDSRARRDAMRHIARDTVDPEEYAEILIPELANELIRANWSERAWRVFVPTRTLRALQTRGLVEAGTAGKFLTAFGLAVRRALLCEDI